MRSRSLHEQVQALVASASVPPPMPDFSRRLSPAAWDDVIRTLRDEAIRSRFGRTVFPVDQPHLVTEVLAHIERGRLPGELPLLDRFLALATLACHPGCPSAVLDAAARIAGAMRAEPMPDDRAVLYERCVMEIASRDPDGRFARMRDMQRARDRARQEEQEALERRAAEARMDRTARAFARPPFSAEVPPDAVRLDGRDVRLVAEWCGAHGESLLRLFHRAGGGMVRFAEDLAASPNHPARNELNRNLSARTAEKAVKWFYENRVEPAARVVDVSLTQEEALHPDRIGRREPAAAGGDEAWRWQDLSVHAPGEAPVPLDVKNARAMPVRRGRMRDELRDYAEHCVAGFKKDRDRTDVRIAGVFSPERRNGEMLRSVPGEPLLFLGETVGTLLPRLQERFGIPGQLELDLRARPRARHAPADRLFVPPWMYMHPRSLYAGSDELLRQARSEILQAARMGARATPALWPLILAAGLWRAVERWAAPGLPEVWRVFGRQLARGVRHGRSLPVIYLTVLRHFLLTVRDGRTSARFDPARYRDFLFGGAPPNLPLGLVDPLQSVDSLIGSLVELRGARGLDLSSLDRFHFRQTGVLYARERATGQWKTLLFPYCGRGCGRTRLVLGRDGAESCGGCGRIRCPGCGFCTRGCTGGTPA